MTVVCDTFLFGIEYKLQLAEMSTKRPVYVKFRVGRSKKKLPFEILVCPSSMEKLKLIVAYIRRGLDFVENIHILWVRFGPFLHLCGTMSLVNADRCNSSGESHSRPVVFTVFSVICTLEQYASVKSPLYELNNVYLF